jgi:hypothetical protein
VAEAYRVLPISILPPMQSHAANVPTMSLSARCISFTLARE